MNYIRGAITAPYQAYQYYKDLPPINPATLTGAIDVIVIQRPTDSGDLELACSPFHVRFGKWQVLRPADKKVNVSVNGHRIPFDMKIGEAGEAFFVFETEQDVPEELITSPVLRATSPVSSPSINAQDLDANQKLDQREPEFLDLNTGESSTDTSLFQLESHLPSPPVSPSPIAAEDEVAQNRRADEALKRYVRDIASQQLADVQYRSDVTLDAEGYRVQPKTKSRQDDASSLPFPSAVVPKPVHLRAKSPPPLTRANSPPALDIPLQEYSWDWGAFPSPLRASYSKDGCTAYNMDGAQQWQRHPLADIRLVPVNDGNEEDYGFGRDSANGSALPEQFGAGGIVRPSKDGPMVFVLIIEGRRSAFELSLVDLEACDDPSDADEATRVSKLFDGHDEVSAEQLFERGKIDFNRFIHEDVLQDPRLVLRWAGIQYITKADASPLMDALCIWRAAAINQDTTGTRPVSPTFEERLPLSPPSTSDEEDEDDSGAERRGRAMGRAKTEPLPETTVRTKPSSSSWAQWWRRGKTAESVHPLSPGTPTGRPTPRETVSVPVKLATARTQPLTVMHSDSAPVIPVTPVSQPTGAPADDAADNVQLRKRFAKTLRLSSDQLKALNLKPGPNAITFSLATSGSIACTARIFVWDSSDLVLVSDIDGTITKSDGLGHVFAMIGRDWTHSGVAKLYTDICRNGYKIMYLTSRAIGQADATRDYLKGINQNNYQLPEGPVIMSPDRLLASLHREVIMRKPEVFKMACLRDIQRLFGEGRNPFYAGFGNRITDGLSYRSVNIPSARIFTIDSTGEVKLELLELAGYKSSYIHMTDLVDQMFPPINRKWAPEYTDFKYWRPLMGDFPLPDLSPPSPALSARSDNSTLARIRNFSLVSSSRPKIQVAATPNNGGSGEPQQQQQDVDAAERRLRQMSSFERISSSFGFSTRSTSLVTPRSTSPMTPRSTSPTSRSTSPSVDWTSERDGRTRTTSSASISGPLFDEREEDEEEESIDGEDSESHDGETGSFDGSDQYEERDYLEGEDQAVEEDHFDEDLFATGEMKDVPFL